MLFMLPFEAHSMHNLADHSFTGHVYVSINSQTAAFVFSSIQMNTQKNITYPLT